MVKKKTFVFIPCFVELFKDSFCTASLRLDKLLWKGFIADIKYKLGKKDKQLGQISNKFLAVQNCFVLGQNESIFHL